MVAGGVGLRQGGGLDLGWHMRRAIYRVLDDPWGFRITCGVPFVIVMGGLRYGAHLLSETHDRTLISEVCIPALAIIFALSWLIDRHNARPH